MTDACSQTGKSLSTLKNVILLEWETLVRGVISSSRHESSIIILDHVPDILDQLEGILNAGQLDEIELGKHHGYHRSRMTDFSLSDILTEYSLLREVLITYLYPLGDIDCAKTIHKFIDILLKHSAVEYVNAELLHRSLTMDRIGNEVHEMKSNPIIPIRHQ